MIQHFFVKSHSCHSFWIQIKQNNSRLRFQRKRRYFAILWIDLFFIQINIRAIQWRWHDIACSENLSTTHVHPYPPNTSISNFTADVYVSNVFVCIVFVCVTLSLAAFRRSFTPMHFCTTLHYEPIYVRIGALNIEFQSQNRSCK